MRAADCPLHVLSISCGQGTVLCCGALGGHSGEAALFVSVPWIKTGEREYTDKLQAAHYLLGS